MGGIHVKPPRLMGGIYEILRFDGLSCHDICAKFCKDWFKHSEVDRGIHKHADTQMEW
jgi:hypothetical protein